MKEEIKSIIVKTPDDWHLHLRESPIIEKVFPYSYKSYGRAIIMPNLEIPIITFISWLIIIKNKIEYDF